MRNHVVLIMEVDLHVMCCGFPANLQFQVHTIESIRANRRDEFDKYCEIFLFYLVNNSSVESARYEIHKAIGFEGNCCICRDTCFVDCFVSYTIISQSLSQYFRCDFGGPSCPDIVQSLTSTQNLEIIFAILRLKRI